jgi:hypothetical protein
MTTVQRNPDGTWKGSGNPKGRPPRETEREYLEATIANVSIEDWRDIVEKAVEQAKHGHSGARTWLAEYLLGKPEQVHRYLVAEQKEVMIRVVFERHDDLPALGLDEENMVDADDWKLEADEVGDGD